MWKWIKKLFKPERQLVLDVEVEEEKMPVEELLQLTKRPVIIKSIEIQNLRNKAK